MESEIHIYLQICADCGRPALTLDEQHNAHCAEHAAVFIPAGGTPQDQAADAGAR